MMYQDVQRGSVHGPYTAGYTGPGGFGSYGGYGGLGSVGGYGLAVTQMAPDDPRLQTYYKYTAKYHLRPTRAVPDTVTMSGKGGVSKLPPEMRPDYNPYVDGSSAPTSDIPVLAEGAVLGIDASWWPWIIGGTAVVLVGGGITYAVTRKKKRSKS